MKDFYSRMETSDKKIFRKNDLGERQMGIRVSGWDRNSYPNDIYNGFAERTSNIITVCFAVNKKGRGQRWGIFVFANKEMALRFLYKEDKSPLVLGNQTLLLEHYKVQEKLPKQKFRFL